MDTIYIQIASYKDPELRKTILDCLSKATYPDRLTFGICWQKTEEETLGEYTTDRRFRIHIIPWQEAKGVGWARSICNGLYNDETYTLQIDSHHRFIEGWDVEIINQWKMCNHPKAVLSGYPPGYEYNLKGQEIKHHLQPMTMVVKGFDHGFIPTFKSWHVFNTSNIKGPFRGCFIAAGFMFTAGKVCRDVPYAKDVYFTGEEILHSIRLFTHGYRIFYPHKWVLWHLYERRTSERHWDDFTKTVELTPAYCEIQTKSNETLKGALLGDSKYAHLFGTMNTVEDFETYSGTSILHRVVHPNMIKGYEPPFAYTKGWEDVVKPYRQYRVIIDIDIKDIPDRDDYTFWYFGLHDKDCTELHRHDIKNNKEELFKKEPKVYRETVVLRDIPVKYIIWPHSKEKGWHDRLVYDVPKGAVTPL